MLLRFSDPEEFVSELRQAPPNAEPVLRLSARRSLDPTTGAFTHVAVIATYLRVLPDGPDPKVVVVALDCYQGEDWGDGFEGSRATGGRADKVLTRLRSAPGKLGLVPRRGLRAVAARKRTAGPRVADPGPGRQQTKRQPGQSRSLATGVELRTHSRPTGTIRSGFFVRFSPSPLPDGWRPGELLQDRRARG